MAFYHVFFFLFLSFAVWVFTTNSLYGNLQANAICLCHSVTVECGRVTYHCSLGKSSCGGNSCCQFLLNCFANKRHSSVIAVSKTLTMQDCSDICIIQDLCLRLSSVKVTLCMSVAIAIVGVVKLHFKLTLAKPKRRNFLVNPESDTSCQLLSVAVPLYLSVYVYNCVWEGGGVSLYPEVCNVCQKQPQKSIWQICCQHFPADNTKCRDRIICMSNAKSYTIYGKKMSQNNCAIKGKVV